MTKNTLEKLVRDAGLVAGFAAVPGGGPLTLTVSTGNEVDRGSVTAVRTSQGVITFTVRQFRGPRALIVALVTSGTSARQQRSSFSYSGETATVTVTSEDNTPAVQDSDFFWAFLAL